MTKNKPKIIENTSKITEIGGFSHEIVTNTAQPTLARETFASDRQAGKIDDPMICTSETYNHAADTIDNLTENQCTAAFWQNRAHIAGELRKAAAAPLTSKGGPGIIALLRFMVHVPC